MRDTTRFRYDLFKEDLAGNPCWIESVAGFVEAVSEMEKLAANEPCDYFLFCAQSGTVVGRLHRQPGVMRVESHYEKAS